MTVNKSFKMWMDSNATEPRNPELFLIVEEPKEDQRASSHEWEITVTVSYLQSSIDHPGRAVPSPTPKPSKPRTQCTTVALPLRASRGSQVHHAVTAREGVRPPQSGVNGPTGNPQEGPALLLLHMLKEVNSKQVLTTACWRHSRPTAAECLIFRCNKLTDSKWVRWLQNRSILYLALHTSFPPKWVELE